MLPTPTSHCSAGSSRSCKFTNGELFFPMATGPFVESCDLLEGPTLREAKIVVPSGALDLDRLGSVDDPPPGHSQYLRFVPEADERRRAQPMARPAGRAPCSTRPAGSPGSASPLDWSMPAS